MVYAMKKIFLAGSEGFIGSNFVHHHGDKFSITRADKEYAPGLGVNADLTVPWPNIGYHDVVISAASAANVWGSTSGVKVGHEAAILENGILQCLKYEIPRLIHLSSSSIYGKTDKFPFEESSYCRPISRYGFQKLMAETLLDYYSYKYPELTIISVRLFNAIGFRQRKTMLPWAIMEALETGKLLTFYGVTTRAWTYVKDIVDFLALLSVTDKVKPGRHVFNYGTTTALSQHELLALFEEKTGKAAQVAVADYRPYELKATSACMRKVATLFGPQVLPTSDLNQAITEVVTSYRRWVDDSESRLYVTIPNTLKA